MEQIKDSYLTIEGNSEAIFKERSSKFLCYAFHVESEEEILSVGVPKAIMLYRSKIIERMIDAQMQRLQSGDLGEDEAAECMKQMDQLNQMKLMFAKGSQRLIL